MSLSAVSDSRETAANTLDISLNESGGANVFNSVSAVHVMNSIHSFKESVRRMLRPSAFSEDGRMNEDVLQKFVIKPALAAWLGTALKLLDRTVIHIKDAAKLESSISCAREENWTLLKEKVEDQKTVIQLQQKLIEKKENDSHSVTERVQKEVMTLRRIHVLML